MNQAAAIYTRVSSDRQKENDTIASQTAALVEYAKAHGYAVPQEWIFQDEGYSGASSVRFGLRRRRTTYFPNVLCPNAPNPRLYIF